MQTSGHHTRHQLQACSTHWERVSAAHAGQAGWVRTRDVPAACPGSAAGRPGAGSHEPERQRGRPRRSPARGPAATPRSALPLPLYRRQRPTPAAAPRTLAACPALPEPATAARCRVTGGRKLPPATPGCSARLRLCMRGSCQKSVCLLHKAASCSATMTQPVSAQLRRAQHWLA